MLSHTYQHPLLMVLIDTWWNVNKMIYKLLFCRVIVLIDTWWNVNKYNTEDLVYTGVF